MLKKGIIFLLAVYLNGAYYSSSSVNTNISTSTSTQSSTSDTHTYNGSFLGNIDIEDTNVSDINISASHAGSITIDVQSADDINISSASAGDINITADSIKNIYVDVSHMGNINIFVKNIEGDLKIEGASSRDVNIDINEMSGEVDFDISWPGKKNISVNGSSVLLSENDSDENTNETTDSSINDINTSGNITLDDIKERLDRLEERIGPGYSTYTKIQEINITKGWQLVGTLGDINLTNHYLKGCIDSVWKYKNGLNNKGWEVAIFENDNSSYPLVNRTDILNKGDGFWVKGNSECKIDIKQIEIDGNISYGMGISKIEDMGNSIKLKYNVVEVDTANIVGTELSADILNQKIQNNENKIYSGNFYGFEGMDLNVKGKIQFEMNFATQSIENFKIIEVNEPIDSMIIYINSKFYENNGSSSIGGAMINYNNGSIAFYFSAKEN